MVDVDISASDFAEGRNTLIGVASTGFAPGLNLDFEKSGE